MKPVPRRYEPQRQPESSYQLELGGKAILGLFFALAVVCGMFFAFGYTLGKHAIPATFSLGSTPVASVPLAAPPAGVQPPNPAELGAAESDQTPAGLTPAPATADTSANPTAGTAATATAASSTPAPASGTAANTTAPVPATPAPAAAATPAPATGGVFYVQVFAGVQSDAQSVAARLQTLGYPVVVAPPDAGDANLYRVQVGPYLTSDEAQAMRSRLVADGYQAIVKNQ